MSDLNQRIAALTPEERTLFERELMRGHALGNNGLSIPRRAEPGPCVLSFGQERLWFLSQIEPDSPVYNTAKAFRIKGVLNVEALKKALHSIVSRHELLRTALAVVDDSPMQIIAETWSLVMPVIDLLRTPEAGREEELQYLILKEARRPFNLSQDLMLRATLLRLDAETHVLLLAMHHIASDGWSIGILFRELGALYENFSTGRPSDLPELPIQYADYSLWQRGMIDDKGLRSHLSYWKEQLSPGLSFLELPTDRPRPAVETFRGGEQTHVLSRRLMDALEALSRQEEVSLFMTLLAAFQTLLHRYTSQDDIWVGSPIAGRTRRETEGLIGFFLNTLVLRTDLSGNPSFKELLGRVRETVLGASDHQDLPFERLVEELEPERSLSHSPLFNVMFVLQNTPGPSLQLPGLTVSSQKVDTGTAKFDLTLSMTETEEGLRALVEFNTDLFDDVTVARMMGHLQTLLEGIVAHPDQTISDLPLLTEAERHQLLVEWNDTSADYPKDKCIHQLFEDQVERTPDATAVVFEDEQLTFRELDRRANQLAHHLRGLGVRPEVLVGICMERSLEMVVGLLGILKAGGAYLPLDPEYPKQRIAFMLEDAQAPVLLSQKRICEDLSAHGARVICLDTGWEAIAREKTDKPEVEVSPEGLAYVLYTSGSTGRPKGVAIEHHSPVGLVDWARGVFDAEDLAGVLASTSVCFDLSVFELFIPLSWGGTVILVKDALHLRMSSAQGRVTLINTVPSVMAELLREGDLPASVRTVNLAGEPLSAQLVQEIYQQKQVKRVFDLYGPSEDTTYSTYSLREENGPVTIGKPISNRQAYILDDNLQIVPIGVFGELHLAGNGVARGYLNRPELTEEKFIPNHFSEVDGRKLYKTGDLARYSPDGNIEFLGRIDNQVKIRGFRVEPGEIEAVLRQHPGVENAVVVGQDVLAHEGSTQLNIAQRLVAYTVSNRQPTPSESELRRFLKEKLPSYMVPSAFVMLNALPLTANGKVDLQGLPSSDQAWCKQRGDFVAPRDPMELQLTEIWQEVLGVSRVGVTDDFFELGGSSLLGASVVTKINKKVGSNLPLSILFQAPTVADMTVAVTQMLPCEERMQPASSVAAVQPNGSKPPLFCVARVPFVYRRLADYLGPDQPIYSVLLHDFDSRELPFAQIEARAAQHVEDIRAVQPEGPYYLAGNAFRGVVAIEIARRLIIQGHEVGLVALFDTYLPGLYGSDYSFYTHSPINYHWKQRMRLRNLIRQAIYKVYQGIGRPVPGPLQDEWWVQGHATIYGVGYNKQIYDGDVTLFRAKDHGKGSNNSDLGWAQLVSGRFEVYEVPGDDCHVFAEDNIQELAAKLSEALYKARTRHFSKVVG